MPVGARITHSYTAFESASRLIPRPGAAPLMAAIPMLEVVCDPRRPKEKAAAVRAAAAADAARAAEPGGRW